MKDWKETRRKLAAFIKAVEDLDGSYINKLGEKSRDRLSAAWAAMDGEALRRPVTGNKVDLSPIRKELALAEQMIHERDTLETIPELEEYSALIEELAALERRMAEQYDNGHNMPARFVAHRLVRGRVQWG